MGKVRTFTADQILEVTQSVGDMTMSDPDDGMVTVEGQAAVYGNWFVVAESGDVMIQRRNNPKMFARSLSQNPDVTLKVDHNVPVASTRAGTLKIWEDPDGLKFQGRVNTRTSAGNDLFENMKTGLYQQGSVKYWALKDAPREAEWVDGRLVQYQDIIEGKLHQGDVTICVDGMNPACATSLKQARTTASGLIVPTESDYDLLRQREQIRVHLNKVAGIPFGAHQRGSNASPPPGAEPVAVRQHTTDNKEEAISDG